MTYDRLLKIEAAARALLKNAGGLLLPYKAYKDGETIRLDCSKADVVALEDALAEFDSKAPEWMARAKAERPPFVSERVWTAFVRQKQAMVEYEFRDFR